MDLIVNEMLLDCLNLAKIVYKHGLKGTLILGDKYQKVFTALPEYYTLTDHDIRIVTSSEITRDVEQIKSIIPEFVKSGGLPPDLIIEAITCKNIPELKYKVKKAMQIQKEENNKEKQLAKQAEQLEKQLKEVTKELSKSRDTIQKLNQAKLQLEQKEIEMKYQVEWYKARTDRGYKEGINEENKRRTEIEIQQLTDNNPYNDIVRKLK